MVTVLEFCAGNANTDRGKTSIKTMNKFDNTPLEATGVEQS